MSRLFVAVLAIALIFSMTAPAQFAPDGGAGKPAEDKAAAGSKNAADKQKVLEELLSKVLQNSPDVQVAEARLKEAEAAYRQARLLAAQKTVELQQSKEQKQIGLTHLESELKRLMNLREAGSVSSGEVAKLESDLAIQKAQLAQIESQVNVLSGKLPFTADFQNRAIYAPLVLSSMAATRGPITVPGFDLGGGVGTGDGISKRQPQATMAGRLRGLLGTTIKVPEHADSTPLPDLINFIRTTTGAPILTKNVQEEVARIDFKGEVTLAAYFQMLCDAAPSVTVYVRDYGFLITTEGSPDDAIPLMEFWRGNEKGSK